MAPNPLWCPEIHDQIEKKLYNDKILEMPLSMYIFDIPDVHEYKNKNATKFLKKLSETEHIELFKSPSVRAIVEMKWPLVKTVMTKYLLYPF